jgi:hypothetical protein
MAYTYITSGWRNLFGSICNQKETPNGLRYWALGRAWILFESRKKPKRENYRKKPQNPQRPVHLVRIAGHPFSRKDTWRVLRTLCWHAFDFKTHLPFERTQLLRLSLFVRLATVRKMRQCLLLSNVAYHLMMRHLQY